MKRYKLSTIVISACLALSALAGCSQGSAPAAGTMPDRATPHESEGVASEISAIIYDAEDPEDAAEAPADEDSFSGNYTDSVDGKYADPDIDRQIYANAFVSAFAEQNISEMDTENLTVEEYLDFVRIYLKNQATDLISYEPKGEMLFETFTLASAHEVIKVFFGFLLLMFSVPAWRRLLKPTATSPQDRFTKTEDSGTRHATQKTATGLQ